jgi:hypothetical protein
LKKASADTHFNSSPLRPKWHLGARVSGTDLIELEDHDTNGDTDTVNAATESLAPSWHRRLAPVAIFSSDNASIFLRLAKDATPAQRLMA